MYLNLIEKLNILRLKYYSIVRTGFELLAQNVDGPGPKSSNNEFVENELENWVLITQTNLKMDLDLERKKKKRVCVGVNHPWQDSRSSVLIYCFLV